MIPRPVGPVPSSRPQPAGHFSRAYQAGGFLFVCGQVSRDKGEGISYATEVTQAIEGLEKELSEAGADLTDVVAVTVYVVGLFANKPEVDSAYATKFGDHRPARAMVGITELGGGGRVEIVATAWIGDRD